MNFEMRKSFLTIIILLIITSISCNYKSTVKREKTSDTFLSKQIVFPKSLVKLDGLQGCKIDSVLGEIENTIKIISIVDGACPKCITNQLNYTDSLFSSIIENEDVRLIFILNVFSEDSVYFMRYTQPYISAKGIIFWDNNYNFEQENKLFSPDENLRTFMIDKDNKIVVYGNPVLNKDIIVKYKLYLDGIS